jgi:NADH-quinone oxidoreductase subunit M
MEITNNWILPALILVPFIAGFACWLVDKLDKHLPRYIALVGMLITLGLTLILWKQGGFSYELGAKLQLGQQNFIYLGLKHLVLTFIWL